jgi:uncharacterized membrane protein YoaK (UPF0700 family)
MNRERETVAAATALSDPSLRFRGPSTTLSAGWAERVAPILAFLASVVGAVFLARALQSPWPMALSFVVLIACFAFLRRSPAPRPPELG